MFINDLFNDKNKTLNEVSNELLGRYKKAAGADASAADKRGDVEQGNKRFKGIVKATIKQGENDAKKHKAQGVAEGSMIDDLLDAPGKVIRKAQDAARGMPPGTVPDSQDDLVNTATKIGKQVIDTATDAARGIPTGTVPKPQKDKDVKEQIGDVPKGWEAKTQPDGSTRISKIGSMSSADYKQNMADYKAKNWTPEKMADYSQRMASGQGYTDAERSANYQQQQQHFGQYADKPLDEQEVAEGLPQTLRKFVPGYAKREIDRKMDAEKFGRTDVDRDANYYRYKKIQDKIKEKGVAEGKKPDSYHIVNKDSKPASLASYADRASAEKDRDAKHPGAEVRQVGPRGKVKGVSENNNMPNLSPEMERARQMQQIMLSDAPPQDDNLNMLKAWAEYSPHRRIDYYVIAKFGNKGPNRNIFSNSVQKTLSAISNFPDMSGQQLYDQFDLDQRDADRLYVAYENVADEFENLAEGAKCNMTEQGRSCSKHGIMECPGYSRLMGEAFKMPPESLQDRMYRQHQELRKKRGAPDPSHYKELAKKKQQEIDALRAEIEADKAKGLKEDRYLEELQRAGYEVIAEKKVTQRLDPKCWKGKHKEGTKIKGGVRVNNCVPNK